MSENGAPATGLPPFARTFRGYDPEEVDSFVGELAERVSMARAAVESFRVRERDLEREVTRLRAEVDELARARPIEADPSSQPEADDAGEPPVEVVGQEEDRSIDRIGDEVARVLEAASEASAAIRRRADEQAAELIAEARATADRLVEEARRAAHAERGTITGAAEQARAAAATDLEKGREQLRQYRRETEARAAALLETAHRDAQSRVSDAQARAEALISEAERTQREIVVSLEALRAELEEQMAAGTVRQRDLQADFARLSDFLRGLRRNREEQSYPRNR